MQISQIFIHMLFYREVIYDTIKRKNGIIYKNKELKAKKPPIGDF